MLVYLLLILPVAYVSHFLHELGHAVVGRLCGAMVTSFGMGVGRPWLVCSWRGAKTYLCPRRPFQGLTFFVFPELLPTRARMCATLAGGILVHALIVVGSFLAWRRLPVAEPVWLTLLIFNGFGLLGNLTPLTVRIGKSRFRSDGAQILRVLRVGALESSAAERIQVVAALRPLWTGVGDQAALRLQLAAAAVGCIELDDQARAVELLAELESIPAEEPAALRPTVQLCQAMACHGLGRMDEGDARLAAAEQEYRLQKHAAGLFLAALARVEARIRKGEAVAAEEVEALAGQPLVAARPLLRTYVLPALLHAAVSRGDEMRVNELLLDHLRLRVRFPSATRDLAVHRGAGRFFTDKQKWNQAVASYDQALQALKRIREEFIEPAEQARLMQTQSALIAEAKQCLVQAGRSTEADQLETRFSPEQAAREAEADRIERNRRLRRLAWVITSVNVLVVFILGLVFGKWDQWERYERFGVGYALGRSFLGRLDDSPAVHLSVFGLAMALVFYAALLAVFELGSRLLVMWAPRLRSKLGMPALFLALIPWPTGLGFVLAAQLRAQPDYGAAPAMGHETPVEHDEKHDAEGPREGPGRP